MMKLSAKPISSPGRTEKFPPPLMRFLRSNVGSRSRGRSRSSPMFLRKKASAAETQEPSSPKVTCMGQVRVRRSKKPTKKPGQASKSGAPATRRCKWIRKALFCRSCTGTLCSSSFRPVWRRWVLFFQAGFGKKVETRQESPKIEAKLEAKTDESRHEHELKEEEETEELDDEEEEAKVFVSNTPPKNALLLTRCRSAPYRSSSLACRFWGSPLRTEETEQQEEEEEEEESKTEQITRDDEHVVDVEIRKPTSESESICRDSDQESRIDPETEEKLGLFKEYEGSIKQTTVKSEPIEEPKTQQPIAGAGAGHPLLLTRCKSEPARTAAEKLDPEMNFWKLRRFGVADSRSPQIL